MLPDWRDVEAALRAQGWRSQATRDGMMWYPPDRRFPPITVHRNPSDPGIRKALSRMKHSGLSWPSDQRGE